MWKRSFCLSSERKSVSLIIYVEKGEDFVRFSYSAHTVATLLPGAN